MKLNVRVGQFYSGQITKKWVSFKPALTHKQGKTGIKQLFEWTPTLKEVIARGRALSRPIPGLYLFRTRRGQPYTDAGFKAMWNRIQVKWAESGGERFTFHDIRAKALTDAKRLGLDAQAWRVIHQRPQLTTTSK